MAKEKELFENVDINSSVAVYIQIENHILFAVASGRIKAGDVLPSIKKLAKRVDVNFNTVAKSYRDLEVMGIVYTRKGMGVYVSKDAETKCRKQCLQERIGRICEVVAEARAAGMTQKEIRNICNASFSSEVGPYAPTPKALLALAKANKAK